MSELFTQRPKKQTTIDIFLDKDTKIVKPRQVVKDVGKPIVDTSLLDYNNTKAAKPNEQVYDRRMARKTLGRKYKKPIDDNPEYIHGFKNPFYKRGISTRNNKKIIEIDLIEEENNKRAKRVKKEVKKTLFDDIMGTEEKKPVPVKSNKEEEKSIEKQEKTKLLFNNTYDINDKEDSDRWNCPKMIERKINMMMNEILDQPFELEIDREEAQRLTLPVEYKSFDKYLHQNSKILVDEIRSQLMGIRKSEEFSNRKGLKVSLLPIRQPENEFFLYKLILPDDKGKKEIEYKELLMNLNIGIPLIYVIAKNRQGKKREFLGMRTRIGNDDFTDEYFFRFPNHFRNLAKNSLITIEGRCTYLSDFNSSMRELQALANMGSSSFDIFHNTIRYRDTYSLKQNERRQDYTRYISRKTNDSQKEAINALCCFSEKIGLLQGPPGTGKSFTLVELVKTILLTKRSNKKILICTPSNCALDELILRFTKSFKLYDYLNEKNPINSDKDSLKIIRIGTCSDTTTKPVLEKNLDNIINIKFKGEGREKLRKELHSYIEEIKRLRDKPFNLKSDEDYKRISELSKMIDKRKTVAYKSVNEIKKNIILGSKIIFATLNSAANKHLEQLKGQFSYLIVDEATQASELQTLAPLCLNPSKVILIGDPEQLPATTFHPYSKELKIRRSLFERWMELAFNVYMLKLQYRMVPSICSFSSKHFYNSNLLTSENASKKDYIDKTIQSFIDKNFNGSSICFLDTKGKTTQKHNSFYNSEEITVIKKYVKLLKLKGIKNYGVITPYKQQLRKIKRELYNSFGNDDIPINTVDGFQGKENDIIFVSCVKSLHNKTSQASSIGFLKDARRLNVAITRAKYSLVIIGNVDTLKNDPLWLSLILHIQNHNGLLYFDDRENRNKIMRIHDKINLHHLQGLNKEKEERDQRIKAIREQDKIFTINYGENSFTNLLSDMNHQPRKKNCFKALFNNNNTVSHSNPQDCPPDNPNTDFFDESLEPGEISKL